MRRIATAFGIVLLGPIAGVVLAAPAMAGDEALAALEARLTDVQRRAAVSEVELARLRERVVVLEAEVARLRGGLSVPPAVSAPPPAPPLAPPTATDIEVDDLPDPPAVPANSSVPESPGVGAVEAAPVLAPASASPEARAGYDRGYTLFHQARYGEAEAAFSEFLIQHAETDLGDNAWFWIGESRFQRGEHAAALRAFEETVRRYPQGNKVPDALLKAGQCHELLGDTRAARLLYDRLVGEHASTAAAAVASERIRRLE